jgi:hypothetical protein
MENLHKPDIFFHFAMKEDFFFGVRVYHETFELGRLMMLWHLASKHCRKTQTVQKFRKLNIHSWVFDLSRQNVAETSK